MSSELRFDGRVVIVTGAGNGLGRSHALAFAQRGAKVVVNDLGGGRHGEGRSSLAADAVVAEIKAMGGEAVANAASVEDGDQIVQTALDAFGRIDVVINNAGILRDTSFPKMSEADWDLIYRVHVLGAYRVTKAAWEHLRTQGYGRVIFTSSAAGLYGNFGQANYSTAKMGLVGLGQTLALEGAKRGIHVNVIAPIAGSRLTETIMPPAIVDALKPEVRLAARHLALPRVLRGDGAVFEVGGGFVGKLRWERTVGKTFPVGRELSPEQVRAAWPAITDFGATTHPTSIHDALQPVLENLEKPKKGGNEFIDVDAALGSSVDGIESAYDARDLALYALGVGAGGIPLDRPGAEVRLRAPRRRLLRAADLRRHPRHQRHPRAGGEGRDGAGPALRLRAHPARRADDGAAEAAADDATTLVHKVTVSDIFDKGRNAVVVFTVESRDKATNVPLLKNTISMVIRGAGGWGGERGPAGDSGAVPDRPADAVVDREDRRESGPPLPPQRRLEPPARRPDFAAAFGFPRPILHGLCTFGYVGRAVVAQACGGDPRLFKSIKVRFADSVFPGETLKTELWKEGQQVFIRATVVERDKAVLTHATATLHASLEAALPKEALPKEAPAPSAASSSSSSAAAPSGPASVDVFAALKTFAAQDKAAMTKAGFVYRVTLKDPASVWTLDLKAGDVVAGGEAKADCTLEMLDADFMAMVSGKADPQKLFSTGKLKIGGHIMASQKLEVLMKLDTKLVEAAFAARTGGGTAASVAPKVEVAEPAEPAKASSSSSSSSEPAAPRVIAALRQRLQEQPGLAGEVSAVVALVVKDPDAAFTLDLSAGAGCVADGAPTSSAKATLTIADADLLQLASGQAELRRLYQHGQLRVDGDVGVVHRLTFLQRLL
jgi:(3R)-3-hydroxyacyl-CoA dehydrogenase / 3a,7a,12a-trihydroxy-5b-cholest-24-enoyl-CoA hydratase / enoyl-CoA hydratase 2